MLPSFSPRHKKNGHTAGFSLVEIMVALVIGMLGIIVIFQVFAIFEGQKRSTTGGGDAQNNGAIALFDLQRDIQKSGYGISSRNLLGCNVQLRAGVTLNSIAPVTVNHASIPPGDANTDTLLIVYGNGNGSEEGDALIGANYAVATPSSFAVNDRVIARLATCTPAYLTTVTNNNAPNLTVAGNVDPAGTGVGNVLYTMGSQPRILAYAIRGSKLTICDYMVNDCGIAADVGNPAIWTPIVSDIVNMQAIYEHDSVNPTPAGQNSYIVNTSDKITPTTACGWVRTPAIGLALVARNGQYEKTVVTTADPTWGRGMGGPFTINVVNNPNGTAVANAGNYRYKVFQTIVPIRNIAWQGVQPGC